MKRSGIAAILISFAVLTVTARGASATSTEQNEWIKYSEQGNGDLYFYDRSRVEKFDALRHVWNGIRYKTSLMGAFSFLSLLEIDCSNRTQKTLQSTFYSDRNWEKAAMKTDTSESAKRHIEAGSTMERLTDIVCDQ